VLEVPRKPLAAGGRAVTNFWIECKDRMPSNMQPVLVVYLGHTQWIAYRWCQDHWEPTEDGSDDAPADAFTHWMALPEPPAPLPG
jgi:hypothetical protein